MLHTLQDGRDQNEHCESRSQLKGLRAHKHNFESYSVCKPALESERGQICKSTVTLEHEGKQNRERCRLFGLWADS